MLKNQFLTFSMEKRKYFIMKIFILFKKSILKSMSNGVYGKTMEKLRNRADVKLVNNEKDYLELDIKLRSTKKLTTILWRLPNHCTLHILAFTKPAFFKICILGLSKNHCMNLSKKQFMNFILII